MYAYRCKQVVPMDYVYCHREDILKGDVDVHHRLDEHVILDVFISLNSTY
jgi:hypothetical protein